MKITCIVENNSCKQNLKEEHGLSLLLETKEWNLLFDTGQSGTALIHNAKTLNINLSDVKQAAISHGHYDHTGGLADFISGSTDKTLFCNPGIFRQRYVKRNDNLKKIGNPNTEKEILDSGYKIIPVNSPQEIFPGLWALLPENPDPIPPSMKDFYADINGEMVKDEFPDEIFLMYKAGNGWLLISGCCHKGLEATLDAASKFIGENNLYAILGGFHLGAYSQEKITQLAPLFSEYNIKEIYLNHCSGKNSPGYFKNMPGIKSVYFPAGESLIFE